MVVEADAERDALVDHDLASGLVQQDLDGVAAGWDWAGTFEIDGMWDVAVDLPLGRTGAPARPAVEDDSVALRLEPDDGAFLTLGAGVQE